MAERNPDCFHMSASAIQAFKACPTRYRLAYREGLREAEDTDSQRMDTNWHALHEVYQNAYSAFDSEQGDPHDAAFNAAVEHLNEQYEQVPATKTPYEWEVEQQTLLMSFVGYLWRWSNDPIEPIASEVEFDLPLHAPKTGMPLPMSQVKRVGMIDTVIRWQGMVGNREIKSTSRSIDPSGDYWERAQKDTQVSMYALAFADMRRHGLEKYGIEGVQDHERVGNTLYDVWHKPTIKPTKLSQKDTAEFLESGKYFDQEFDVKVGPDDPDKPEDGIYVTVDGAVAEVDVGKSGKPAVCETPAMFGARLLSDITERPEFYFQRKELARIDKELQKFRVELFNIYQAMRMYDKTGCWFENEHQCRATFPCPFIPVCYGPGADAVCDGETTPDGLRRIFTDIIVNGDDLNEGE
jgi:hypothetical protein